ALEHVRAEGRTERDVGSVTSAGHHDATDTRNVVPSIESMPAAAKIDLRRSAQVRGLGLGRNAETTKTPSAIAGRSGHAAAQCDRQMGKVAAYPAALDHDVGRRPGSAGVLVAKVNVGMNEIADRLHARPTRHRLTEARPRLLHQTFGFAVSAAEQEHQGVVR